MDKWTEEQITFLKENYKTIGDTELEEIFNSKWKGFTKKGIEKKRTLLKLKRTKIQLQKIRVRNRSRGVWKNNGNNRWENAEQNPIGYRYFCESKKYVIIKTKNGYEPYHRYLWEKHHGNIPKDHSVCFKKDADKRYFTINDLRLIPKKELIKNTVPNNV